MIHRVVPSFLQHLVHCPFVGGVKVQKTAVHDPFMVRHADVGNVHIAHAVLGLECEHQVDTQLPSGSYDKDFGHD